MKLNRPLNSFLIFIFLFTALGLTSTLVKGQDGTFPVYVVQSGDTLNTIAQKFGVSQDDLIQANGITNPNLLSVGDELKIPGLSGISGKIITKALPLGDTLKSITIRHQIPLSTVIRLNRIVSPSEAYVGANLILPSAPENTTYARSMIDTNQTLLEAALRAQQNPWTLLETNQLNGSWDVLPGESMVFPGEPGKDEYSFISPLITKFSISPFPLVQGKTIVIKLASKEPLTLNGTLVGRNLNFFQIAENEYAALQGVEAMTTPGLYPFVIKGKTSASKEFSFEQMLMVHAGAFFRETLQGVDPETLDPKVTKPEEDQLAAIVANITPDKLWSGAFKSPAYDPNWVTSYFGTRRTYNGGQLTNYHSGLDYGSAEGLPIKAPAAGKIVFAGPLTVRGNTTIIDHGWGVYSGFWHQNEFKVKVGDTVQAGQVIGLAGKTGRVTGPHLHWELWVNGIQTDPQDWLKSTYP